jgi:hypothetical protein
VAIEVAPGATVGDELLARAREVVATHPGRAPLELHLRNGGDDAHRFRSRSLQLAPEREPLAALREIFGASRIRLVRAAP